jgi:hypothetical protein
LLGCSGHAPGIDAEEELRLLDACKGVQHLPPGPIEGPPDTIDATMVPADQADEASAVAAFRQIYCSCLVGEAEGRSAAGREEFVTNPPRETREDCEDVAYDRMSEMELGRYLPDDPLDGV